MTIITPMTTVLSEGNLIPADLLAQIAAGEAEGQQPEAFGFARTVRLTDEIAAAWNDARAQWSIFQSRLQRLPDDDPATSVTREFWMIPLLRFLGYTHVKYMPNAALVDKRTYALSHRAGADEDAPPVHIVGVRQALDRRAATGVPRLSPHALLQEYLNATEHLWGIVTNGNQLRLLRDTSRTARPVYIEFDLSTMLMAEKFSEFALLFRLLHRSRLPQGTADAPHCLLEGYHQQAIEAGGRVRDGLREGVEHALRELGNGLLHHPHNTALREQIRAGRLAPLDYYRQLLRLVYRLLFLMVAEERHLIAAAPAAADRPATQPQQGLAIYTRYYSVTRLRQLAENFSALRGGRYGDLWLGLFATFRLLENDDHARVLGLSGLDGDLFSEQAIAHLNATRLTNSALLRAIHALSLYRDPQSRMLRRVNYSALDVEELGSVYESLLDYRPVITTDQHPASAYPTFDLVRGTERKTTGSYYTRPELVQELIASALEPVLEHTLKAAHTADGQAAALLTLAICDPACGSGAFLLAAARRLGLELARIRTGEQQPAPPERRAATRAVIAQCIFGVDLNPLAVDLCKLSLWIEGHNAGMPLSFLDSHIRHGNSLVGAWAELVAQGIPDAAFKPLSGDDKAAATALRNRNKRERQAALSGQLALRLTTADPLPMLAQHAQQLDAAPDHTVDAVRAKAAAYQHLRDTTSAWYTAWTHANLWLAAFFLPLTRADDPTIPTSQTLFAFAQHPAHVRADLIGRVNALAHELAFFHWELEFPHVFERGGFDLVLGNPPWERITLQEKEHFVDVPAIRDAGKAADRKRIIGQWRTSNDPAQLARIAQWDAALHYAEATSVFVHSDAYPLTGRGDTNTYALFAELARRLLAPTGRAGIIVPTGIATDATTQYFFGDLVVQQHLVSLYDFENRAKLFADVDSRYRFSLLTMGRADRARLIFFAHHPQDLTDEQRLIVLSPDDISRINPNTRTAPIFRTRADADLTTQIYRRVPVLVNEQTKRNPWGVSFMAMLHMSGDSGLFKDHPAEGRVPLYEAKLIHQYTHRWATYLPDGSTRDLTTAELADPHFTITPRYWVDAAEVEARLAGKWQRQWLLGWRDIARSTDERTAIFSLLPRVAVGGTTSLVFPHNAPSVQHVACLLATFNSLTFDYIARQKIGGTHLNQMYVKQLPVLPPEAFSPAEIAYIVPRVLELVYTAWDMQPFAQECGYTGAPYGWDERRRAVLRAELDARIARLYGLTRDDLRYILDPAERHGSDFPGETFRVLKEKEQRQHGEYRTARLVLAAWDLGEQ